MSDLVLVMLKYLTQRCNIWQLHTIDEDLIKVSVCAVVSRGETISKVRAANWLLENDWEVNAVDKFKLIVDQLAEGKKIKVNDALSAPTEREMLQRFDDMLKRESDTLSA